MNTNLTGNNPEEKAPHVADDWVRLPRPGSTYFGLTRGYIYGLVRQKKIRSVRIKNSSGKTGVLLIYRPSLIAMIAEAEAAETKVEQPEGSK